MISCVIVGKRFRGLDAGVKVLALFVSRYYDLCSGRRLDMWSFASQQDALECCAITILMEMTPVSDEIMALKETWLKSKNGLSQGSRLHAILRCVQMNNTEPPREEEVNGFHCASSHFERKNA